jgi:hypothetical protein
MESNKELRIIAEIVAFSNDVSTYEVMGIKDTTVKICACWISKEIGLTSDQDLGAHFLIDHRYMNHRIGLLKLEMSLHTEINKSLRSLLQMCAMILKMSKMDINN